METHTAIASGPSSRSEQLRGIVDECWQKLLAGETVDAEAVAAAHPALAPELAAELRVLFRIEEARKAAQTGAGRPALGDATVLADTAHQDDTPPTGAAPVTHTSADLTKTSEDADDAPRRPVSDIPGYEIIRELSHGGQGVVYEALQINTKRKVALKVLLEGRHASTSARRRFLREIELIAQMRHPNIIEIFEAGRSPDGQPFYVMDYVRGEPLHRHIRKNNVPINRVLRLFIDVCEAVQYAHQRGIIHRDLKPSNILVDADGTPRVLDFGLAKPLHPGDGDEALTISDQILGTLPYMAPEQTRGTADEADTRTDVYALGVILYELLTGHFPYPVTGRLAEVLQHIASTPPDKPRRKWSTTTGALRRPGGRGGRSEKCPIDDDLEVITLKALNKDRERRYQSAGELAADVRHYLAGDPIQAKRDSAWYVLRKLARRHIYATGVIALLAATVVAFGAIVFSFWMDAREQSRIRAVADAATIERLEDTNQAIHNGLKPQILRMKLGWFLLEWNAGRRAAAQAMLDSMPRSSVEKSAMAFLLDETISPEQLIASVGADEWLNVAFLAIGERHMRTGRTDEAARAFEAALAARGGENIREAAQARLDELRPATPATTPAGARAEGNPR